MALSIKNDEADRLARQLCDLTGESLTEAVIKSLQERLRRTQAETDARPIAERLMARTARLAKVRRLTVQSPDEVLGYDENGLPT